MKKIILILIVITLFSGSCRNTATKDNAMENAADTLDMEETADTLDIQTNILSFDSLDRKTILKRLFDNSQIDSVGEALWMPNYSERLKIHLSYDGKCHTAIDTIMYFTDCRNRLCAVVIFAHYRYDYFSFGDKIIDRGGSHFEGVPLGAALFTRRSDKWELYAFEKHFSELGYFGEIHTNRQDAGEISLKKIGNKWTCLSLKQGIGGNMGVFYGYETFFPVEEYRLWDSNNYNENSEFQSIEIPVGNILQDIFAYYYYFSEFDLMIETGVLRETNLHFIQTKTNYFDINLITTTTKEKYADTITISTSSKTAIKQYYYNETYNRYLPK